MSCQYFFLFCCLRWHTPVCIITDTAVSLRPPPLSLPCTMNSFSVTMMSRLMLNLHQTADEGIYTMSSTINKTNTEFSLGGKYDNTTTYQTTTTMTNRVELDTIWSTNNGNSFSAQEEDREQAIYARQRSGSVDFGDEMIAMTPRRSSRSTSRARERRSHSQSQI